MGQKRTHPQDSRFKTLFHHIIKSTTQLNNRAHNASTCIGELNMELTANEAEANYLVGGQLKKGGETGKGRKANNSRCLDKAIIISHICSCRWNTADCLYNAVIAHMCTQLSVQ